MDLLLVAVIAGAAFFVGRVSGYLAGRHAGEEQAVLRRRLDELSKPPGYVVNGRRLRTFGELADEADAIAARIRARNQE